MTVEDKPINPASEHKIADMTRQVQLLRSENEVLRQNNIMLLQQIESDKRDQLGLQNKLQVNQITGLPVFQAFVQRINQILDNNNNRKTLGAKGTISRPEFSLLIVKMDGQFDLISKSLKESASEWILYQIGVRLTEQLLKDEEIYHIGDTEFALILKPSSALQLSQRLNKLHTSLNRHHTLAGVRLHVASHIGVALFPQHGRNQTSILHSANLALANGIRTEQPFVIFKESMRKDVIDRMELQNSILKALESQSNGPNSTQFNLVYQPQVSLEVDKDGQLRVIDINAEVLMRWNHPTKGTIPPSYFIPLAEETGLIQPLGTWLVHRTIEQIQAWEGTKLSKSVISINVSPKQFLNDQLVFSLDRIIKRNPRMATKIKLELTESSLLENTDSCLRYMHYLRSLGLQFAVDDFGKDYSSLSYLRKLPVNSIKIDRSFITNIHQSRHDQIIVRAIAKLAKDLKLKIVVEGVENTNQLRFLVDQGCSTIQGFFFSKPVSADSYADFYERAMGKKVVLPKA